MANATGLVMLLAGRDTLIAHAIVFAGRVRAMGGTQTNPPRLLLTDPPSVADRQGRDGFAIVDTRHIQRAVRQPHPLAHARKAKAPALARVETDAAEPSGASQAATGHNQLLGELAQRSHSIAP